MTKSFPEVKKFLSGYSLALEKLLLKFFEEKKKEGAKIDPEIVKALGVFEDYSQGGKKIRGALTLLGYEMAGGKDLKAILPVSAGIELLHNFLLIHDDVIDRDPVRRGKPTVHVLYSDKGEHTGFSKAIAVGDMGAFLGHELIISSSFPKEKTIFALKRLDDLILKTIYGELLDVDYDFRKSLSWEDILRVRLYKTAYYTFVMPLTVGGTFSGLGSKEIKATEAYGASVGIAFQISDDILGIFGEEAVTGKSSTSDIKDGKKTFLYVKALELAKRDEKEFLKAHYGKRDIGKKEIEKVKSIFVSSGSLDYSKALASRLTRKAKGEIKKMTKFPKYQKILSELADYVVLRDK